MTKTWQMHADYRCPSDTFSRIARTIRQMPGELFDFNSSTDKHIQISLQHKEYLKIPGYLFCKEFAGVRPYHLFA
jgi:hypothetical protein